MEEEEEEEEEQVPGKRYREPFHCFHSLSDSEIQFNGYSTVVATGHSHFNHGGDDSSIVFPPSNHEGLHITSSCNHDEQRRRETRESSDSPSDDKGLAPPRLASDSTGAGFGGEVKRWVGFGLELLRSKVTGIASWVRCLSASSGKNWSSRCVVGMAAALLVWCVYAVARRRRRRSRIRRESRDHLILLIKEKDEMNQLLLTLYRDSSARTKD
ncbi:uncharacterized protein LOC127793205 isoform X2 [Diospyros lotus]|uniref:uncharacterized protein LOC127793205 isoform X2 n=1 Tax=Diospyros lotus TaxID=55363 RepID=UPI00224DC598|nr:uncharacterized protein LOC127793205 isoform X2 [Diospyros lotus]